MKSIAKTKSRLCFTLFLSISHVSPSMAELGVGAGKGGDVVICKAKTQSGSSESSDFASELPDYPPGLYSLDFVVTHPRGSSSHDVSVLSFKDTVEHLEQVFERVFPVWLEPFREFARLVENTNVMEPQTWEPSSFRLVDIKDEDLKRILPKNCTEVHDGRSNTIQAVIQERHSEDPTLINFLYDQGLLEKLKSRPLQYSYLLVHEFLWTVGLESASKIRKLNATIHSRRSTKISAAEFLELLYRNEAISSSVRSKELAALKSRYQQEVHSYLKGRMPLDVLENTIKNYGLNPNETWIPLSKLPQRDAGLFRLGSELTLVHIAALSDDPGLLEIAQNFDGFDINKRAISENSTEGGGKPLHYATARNHKAMVDHLLESGARSKPSIAHWKNTLATIIEEGAPQALRDFFNQKNITPYKGMDTSLHPFLIQSALDGKREMSHILMDLGADPLATHWVNLRFEGNRDHKWYGQTESNIFYLREIDAFLAAGMGDNDALYRDFLGIREVRASLNEIRYEVKPVYWDWSGSGKRYRIDKKNVFATVKDIIDMVDFDRLAPSVRVVSLRRFYEVLEEHDAEYESEEGEEYRYW